ncbi:MAG: CpsD/CapB family tyrosine-protein kinase [Bacillota bacterium]
MNSNNTKLKAVHEPKSPVAEAYRILRTNIQFSGLDRSLRSLLVTSSAPNEGKSLTVANLAAAFAQSGPRVLIVDADLRKPTQHKLFSISNLQGLTSVLLGQMELADAVHRVPPHALYVLPTGPIPPNPAELLGSQRMREFIREATAAYDLVFFDTPPVVSVTDAALLGAVVDGVLLVVEAGKTKIELAQKARQLLSNVQARLLGVVLNKVGEGSSDYYYYYHYYYGGSGSGRKRRVRRKKTEYPDS